MLLITHDFGIIARMCDKVAVMYAGKIVECGTWNDMFMTKDHHPYTEGLLGAIPNIESRERRLKPIPEQLRITQCHTLAVRSLTVAVERQKYATRYLQGTFKAGPIL